MGVRNIRAVMPNIFNEAILLGFRISIRTLDLIHVASAKYAKEKNGDLGAFVTADGEILSKKEEFSKVMGMPVLSPREYIKTLHMVSFD